MKDQLYNLINTSTNKIVARNITLSKREVDTLNYAYALNGSSLRYFLV